MAREVDVYAAADKAIRVLDRQDVEAFGRLKMSQWDKVKVIRAVEAVYTASIRRAKKRYYEIGFEAFLLAMMLCEIDLREAHKMAEKAITPKWVDEILKDTDFVTMYRFDTEAERKAYRLAEALEVSEDRNAEIDKALRAWSKQVGQYALNVTDYAMMQAFENAGIEKVMWMSERDNRVCTECVTLNGQVFPINEVPRKPHWACRCHLTPVLDG